MWDRIRPQIVVLQLDKVPNYRGKWLPSAKNQNILAEISEAALQNPLIMDIKHVLIADVT